MQRKTLITLLCVSLAAGAVGGLVGCSSSSSSPFAEEIASWDSDNETLQTSSPYVPSENIEEESSRTGKLVIPDDAGPEDYVQWALERNPAIRSAMQKVYRYNERIAQAKSLNDPMGAVVPIGDMAQTASGQVGLISSVSQKFPFPGKLDAKGRVAQQMVAIAAQDLQATKLSVVADTRQAFWSYYFSIRAIEVTENNRNLLAQFRQIAEAKNKAGTATQQDVLRASVELSNLDNELITWRQRKTTAKAMLNRLLDRRVAEDIPNPKPLELKKISVELDTLLSKVNTTSPSIQKYREQIKVFREQLELAKLNRYPDFTAMVNYAAVNDDGLSPVTNGDDQWSLGVGINLPIWSAKLDAAENEARRGIMESVAALNNEQNRVAFQVQDALAKVDTQQRLVILFRDVIIPQSQQTLDASFSGYRAGKLDFLTLVDNWRKLLNFQLMYHQNLAQLEKDYAILQQVVGRDLQRTNDQTINNKTIDSESQQ